MLNIHEFLHTLYKYVLNSVVKISMMFAKYFEYYIIILRGGVFSWTRCSSGREPNFAALNRGRHLCSAG